MKDTNTQYATFIRGFLETKKIFEDKNVSNFESICHEYFNSLEPQSNDDNADQAFFYEFFNLREMLKGLQRSNISLNENVVKDYLKLDIELKNVFAKISGSSIPDEDIRFITLLCYKNKIDIDQVNYVVDEVCQYENQDDDWIQNIPLSIVLTAKACKNSKQNFVTYLTLLQQILSKKDAYIYKNFFIDAVLKCADKNLDVKKLLNDFYTKFETIFKTYNKSPTVFYKKIERFVNPDFWLKTFGEELQKVMDHELNFNNREPYCETFLEKLILSNIFPENFGSELKNFWRDFSKEINDFVKKDIPSLAKGSGKRLKKLAKIARKEIKELNLKNEFFN